MTEETRGVRNGEKSTLAEAEKRKPDENESRKGNMEKDIWMSNSSSAAG